MIAYGFTRGDLAIEFGLAHRLSVSLLEILPDWRQLPDPLALRARVQDEGLAIHSAHGCWGGQAIRAQRVDLGNPEPSVSQASVEDIKRCVDWLAAAGGTCLVVHPGGLSDPERFEPRRTALASSLSTLADHARGSGILVCVENMPPGVYPGSRMVDIQALVVELDRPELALTLDTGHAQLNSTPAAETLATGSLLRTTHVHDNDGRQDTHLPPGMGTIDWDAWVGSLDAVGYTGPIMLECIRHLRQTPGSINEALLQFLNRLGRTPQAGSRGASNC
jgi:sugar phosphate isomerase/epimerase